MKIKMTEVYRFLLSQYFDFTLDSQIVKFANKLTTRKRFIFLKHALPLPVHVVAIVEYDGYKSQQYAVESSFINC